MQACESLDRAAGLTDDSGLWPGSGAAGGGASMEEGLAADDVAAALSAALSYLRERHGYCLYCGVQFADQSDMASSCPGPLEADHAEV